MIALSHYSHDDHITPYSVPQRDGVFVYEKPHGLWVSVDGEDDWPSWCRDEMPDRLAGSHRHRVVLADDHQVLTLTDAQEVFDFHGQYAQRDAQFSTLPGSLSWYGINWARVAADHQGIIIAPYQWSLRMDITVSWYYPWDCASGCIWDAAAIKEVTLCPN